MFTINKAFFCGHFVLGNHGKKYRDSRNLKVLIRQYLSINGLILRESFSLGHYISFVMGDVSAHR